MTLNKSKCRILRLGQSNAGHKSKLGDRVAGEQPCRKASEAAGRHQAQHHPAVCPGSTEGKLHPRLHQTQHHQPVKRGDHPAVCSAPAASAGPLKKQTTTGMKQPPWQVSLLPMYQLTCYGNPPQCIIKYQMAWNRQSSWVLVTQSWSSFIWNKMTKTSVVFPTKLLFTSLLPIRGVA